MDILFLLIPLSVVLVFLIIAVFAWALKSGQFDDIEREGERILRADRDELDADQSSQIPATEESSPRIERVS
ncbi:cbb3-type cytochrome oxidase assembly protein CcoS [uncultured Sphaerotilus sp.]|uniref:cbb3-type cytochrome oxidase assembly protein CcoS n=1 Tax=uncultured Sphaerotilus sp. TaxID=474984 RepID=UPI0030CA3A86